MHKLNTHAASEEKGNLDASWGMGGWGGFFN
jgi:hypothetical protein